MAMTALIPLKALRADDERILEMLVMSGILSADVRALPPGRMAVEERATTEIAAILASAWQAVRRRLRRPDRVLLPGDDAFWAGLGAEIVQQIVPTFNEFWLAGVQLAAERTMLATGARQVEELAARILGSVDDPMFAEASAMLVETFANQWWQTVGTTTRRSMQEIFVRARAEGWTVEEISTRLAPFFGRPRAELIALTESTRLYGAAAQQTYQRLGVEMWEWRTVEDDRVDDICRSLRDGGPYPMTVAFAPGHVGCRCWVAPVRMPVTS